MTSARYARALAIVGIAVAVVSFAGIIPGRGQQPSGPPNALQGFSQNRDQPVKIDANSLEVRDKDKIATFIGNVHVVQGDTTMRCKVLVVFYDQNSTTGAPKSTTPGPGGSQQIRRMEAKGGVVVTQKDQTAVGDNAVYDLPANTVTMLGNVVISQGQNMVKGDRLMVNLTSGVSKVECGNSGQCRVQALIQPSSGPREPASGGETNSVRDAARDIPRDTPRDTPKQQQRPAHPAGLY